MHGHPAIFGFEDSDSEPEAVVRGSLYPNDDAAGMNPLIIVRGSQDPV
jgi:hypothetical protein